MTASRILLLLALTVCPPTLWAESVNTRLSLEQAEQLWRTHNHEIRLAQDAVGTLRADQISATARPNPQLNLATTAINPRTMRGNPWNDWKTDTSVGISQLIERGDKRQLRIRTAQYASEAGQYQLADTVRSTQHSLEQAYYTLLLAQDLLRISQENASLSQRTLDAAQTRLAAGAISPTEVSRIRVDQLRADSDVTQAAQRLREAQLTLGYLVGLESVSTTLQASDPWPEPVISTARQTDIERRPDIRTAISQLKTAESNIELAQSLTIRDISIGLSYDHNANNPASGGIPVDTVGVSVSLPLQLNYQYDGEIRRAQANRQLAEDQLNARRALAISELTQAKTQLETAQTRLRHYLDQLVVEAKRAATATEFAYEHGAIGVTDLLDARRTFKSVMQEAATAQADYASALAAWRAATTPEETPNHE